MTSVKMCSRSKLPSVNNSVGQNGRRSKMPSVKIAVGEKSRRSKWPSVKAASVKRPGTHTTISVREIEFEFDFDLTFAKRHPKIFISGRDIADGATFVFLCFPLNLRLFLTDFDKRSHRKAQIKCSRNSSVKIHHFSRWRRKSRWLKFFIFLTEILRGIILKISAIWKKYFFNVSIIPWKTIASPNSVYMSKRDLNESV
jgi:hypothetical protein